MPDDARQVSQDAHEPFTHGLKLSLSHRHFSVEEVFKGKSHSPCKLRDEKCAHILVKNCKKHGANPNDQDIMHVHFSTLKGTNLPSARFADEGDDVSCGLAAGKTEKFSCIPSRENKPPPQPILTILASDWSGANEPGIQDSQGGPKTSLAAGRSAPEHLPELLYAQ